MPKINHEEYEILKGLDEKWKWIARDSYDRHDGNLLVYPKKPFKNHYSRAWVCGIWIHPINIHLFQFIEWENENPFSIAELIEEYESEETEVKKDIDWAIQEIEGLETEPSQNYPHDEMIEREIVLGILSQLEEPEVLSQEDNINIVLDDLKEHIKEQQSLSQNVGMAHTSAGNDTHYRQYDYVLECINEYEPSDDLQNLLMPKQELPAIPKFVAEWIEEMKQDERPLYSVMSSLMNKTNYEWAAWESANKNFSEIVAQAWLYGFAVKEEPKYYALIKGHENMDSDDKYWNYCITDKSLDIGDNKVHTDVLAEYVLSATKDEWKNLGINDDNADFVKVKELEE